MFLLALVLPDTVLAQTADLHGVLLDASGQPASGYPWRLVTPQGEVNMKATEVDGTFGVTGLPPGNYELRVFAPGRSSDQPIASKHVTVAAGQAEVIEIRLGSDKGGAAAAATLGATGVNWTIVLSSALLLVAAVVVFFTVRYRQRPAA
jgi:predicted secreted protein